MALSDEDRAALGEASNYCADADCVCGGHIGQQRINAAVEQILARHVAEARAAALTEAAERVDEIEGVHAKFGDDVDVWLHSQEQVTAWLRNLATPPP